MSCHVNAVFGSFGLSTKEPYTIMNCRSFVVIGIVLHQRWHHHHLCTPPPGTWLDIEASYLVYLCTCAQQIFNDSDVVFKWQPFWYFSLICYPVHTGSHRDFTSHVFKYLFFSYIHATVAYFLKFVRIFSKFTYPLLL